MGPGLRRDDALLKESGRTNVNHRNDFLTVTASLKKFLLAAIAYDSGAADLVTRWYFY
jgi:hypothetical protein